MSRFWKVLFLGQFLSFCLVAQNQFWWLIPNDYTTHTTYIPPLQHIFNYLLLAVVYTSYTIYKYGFKGYGEMLLENWWKYLLLSFFDVQGYFFADFSLRYSASVITEIISTYSSIVVVLVISFFALRVRYHIAQVLGILMCCVGIGVFLAKTFMKGGFHLYNDSHSDEVKGDVLMFFAAAFYGLSSIALEYLFSKHPIYEVLGQLGFWGVLIKAVQTSIFDRNQLILVNMVWDDKTGGYLTGGTLCLFLFYTAAPLLLRMASAACFTLSLMTVFVWDQLIFAQRYSNGFDIFFTFGRLYIVGLGLLIVGLVAYNCGQSGLGESKKPWLGEDQEDGIEGVGTAKRGR